MTRPNAATIDAVEPDSSDEAFDAAARVLVASGRVVPGLEITSDGRSRSWWWPLPAASHRALVRSLVDDPSTDGQRHAAERLATATDRLVREELAVLALVPRRAGRPTVTEAWVRSLTTDDPWLPVSLDPAKVRALADAIRVWVRSAPSSEGASVCACASTNPSTATAGLSSSSPRTAMSPAWSWRWARCGPAGRHSGPPWSRTCSLLSADWRASPRNWQAP